MKNPTQKWSEKSSPDRLERRFDFENYKSTREFLDRAAEVSETTGLFPDVNFGRTYVNMTVYIGSAVDGNQSDAREFVRRLDELCECSAAA